MMKTYSDTREIFEGLLAEVKEQARKSQTDFYNNIKKRTLENPGPVVSTMSQGENSWKESQFGNNQWGYGLTWAGQIAEKFYDLPYTSEAKERGFTIPAGVQGRSQCYLIKTDRQVSGVIKKEVAKNLKALFDSYIEKQTTKVNAIIKGRKVKVAGRVGSDLQCYFYFELADGAKFEMKTKIVWVENRHGTYFWRFPTTFHNAYNAQGVKFKGSEASLKKEDF